VLSDVVKTMEGATPKGHVMALAWAALDAGNADRAPASRCRARATPASSCRRCAISMRRSKAWCSPTARGAWDSSAPALVPVRRADNEAMGRVPVPGWLAKYDWEGFVPFDQLPRSPIRRADAS
jgi:penicillin amidase